MPAVSNRRRRRGGRHWNSPNRGGVVLLCKVWCGRGALTSFVSARGALDSLWVSYLESCFGLVVAGLAEAGSEKLRDQRPRLHQIGSVECSGDFYSRGEGTPPTRKPCRAA
jgi:hypothetical protein